MFYANNVLLRKGPLATLWLAAHWDRRLTKAQVAQTSISASVEDLLSGALQTMALRLSGQLLLGMVRIFVRKARYLFDDLSDAVSTLRLAAALEAAPVVAGAPAPQQPLLLPEVAFDETFLFAAATQPARPAPHAAPESALGDSAFNDEATAQLFAALGLEQPRRAPEIEQARRASDAALSSPKRAFEALSLQSPAGSPPKRGAGLAGAGFEMPSPVGPRARHPRGLVSAATELGAEQAEAPLRDLQLLPAGEPAKSAAALLQDDFLGRAGRTLFLRFAPATPSPAAHLRGPEQPQSPLRSPPPLALDPHTHPDGEMAAPPALETGAGTLLETAQQHPGGTTFGGLCASRTRAAVADTFLQLLVLAAAGSLAVRQPAPFSPILVSLD